MRDIVDSVQSVTAVMNEIAQASRSQTTGIEQIHAAISRIDHVTQQNAALVEESAGASEAMRVQANKLAQVVSIFKLDERDELHDVSDAARRAPAAPVAMPLRSEPPGGHTAPGF